MLNRPFTVKYITSKTCLCTFSLKVLNQLQSSSIAVTGNDGCCNYFSVDYIVALSEHDCIGINSMYAKILGIQENSLVTVSEIPIPSRIQSVTISALKKDDHDVLEMLADNVQSTLLNQIRVISNKQKFIIWIGNSVFVVVDVYDVKPMSPGFLDNLTEVVIKPPEAINHISNQNMIGSPNLMFAQCKDYLKSRLILRVVPFDSIKTQFQDLAQPFSVFLFKKMLPFDILENSLAKPLIYTIQQFKNDSSESKIHLIYVRLYFIEDLKRDFYIEYANNENIFVSQVLFDHMSLTLGGRIILEPFSNSLPEVNEIDVYTKKIYGTNFEDKFREFLSNSCKTQSFILNSEIVINIDGNVRCFLKFHPESIKCINVNPYFIKKCKINVINETLPLRDKSDDEVFSIDNFVLDVCNFREIIDKSKRLFTCNAIDAEIKMQNILLTGNSGTGKTTMMDIFKHLLTNYPYFIHCKMIRCKQIKGKTVESLQRLFNDTMYDLIHQQPSILLLDDLHVLCENVGDQDVNAPNAVYFNRVSEMLDGIFCTFCSHNSVGILASASSTSKLNKFIYEPRGNYLFKNVYSICDLTKRDREMILKHCFATAELKDVDFTKLAEKTESFVMRDLIDFSTKAFYESYVEDCVQDNLKLSQKHCEKALDNVTATALDGVNLKSQCSKSLEDIGGLTEAKRVLLETMLWPSQYPNLFVNSPLRLASGLLLYGPPGTGKTILAGAAARHCGLRLISIKGPELLSKYIGASEAAVRHVFQRAQSAKPCVLFFDEFDSLAPRRGHDNTGVTDRVVNQILTQLDGVETLSGVFVIAATSRPDLLDPALLRPGRLDRHIKCSLPDCSARYEILKKLAKAMRFAENVDLKLIAKNSKNFTGADLQAILYTAQLDSLKDVLLDDEILDEKIQQKVINQDQLLSALKNTRPSISRADLLKFERIYKKFEGHSTTIEFIPGSKATLA